MDQTPASELARAPQFPPTAAIALEARLQTVLERVIDWLKYEEAKNAVLITFNGVAAGLLVQWLGSTTVWLSYVFKVCILAFLVSLLIGLKSFYPVTDTRKVHERAKKLRLSRPENDEKENLEPNVLFFADIAGLRYEKYLEKFRSATVESVGGQATQLERDYAREIITNAELTLIKIMDFRMAAAITLTAVAAACVAVFGDQVVGIFEADRLTFTR
jgi:hypothetical protein